MITEKQRRNIILARRRYLESINNNLGHEMWKKKYNCFIVKVRAKDYPNCTDLTPNKKKCNKEFSYIKRSYKNWVDAGKELPPKGSVLYHLDNNPKNDDVENLCIVPRSVMVTMSKKKRHVKFIKANKSNILLTSLEHKINENLTVEEKKQIARERANKWYKDLKNDPIKYEKYKERVRVRLTKNIYK